MVSEREIWVATQRDALLGAGFKPHSWADGEPELWAWVYDELHGEIADVPWQVQNTVVMLDEETMTVDLFVMDPEPASFTPRAVEDIPWWKEWVS